MKRLILVALLSSLLAGCNEDEPRVAWSNLAKHCGIAGASGSNIVPFGPSRAGPGWVWRRSVDNSIQPTPDLVGLTIGTLVARGVSQRCDGTATTDFGFQSVVSPYEKAIPVTGAIAYDLKKAIAVSTRASAMTWDTIRPDAFAKFWPQYTLSHKEAASNHPLVVTRALRVSGFQVILQFNAQDIPALKQRYHGLIKHAVMGDIGGPVRAIWSADGRLTLVASNDFYVAGELTPVLPAGRSRDTSLLRGKPINTPALPNDKRGTPLQRVIRP